MRELTVEEALRQAQSAWDAAGKQTPCFEPNYLAARRILVDAYERETTKCRAKLEVLDE